MLILMKRKSLKAFSLIELLLVVSMMGMIAVTVFNVFVNGFKIWEKAYQFSAQEDALIFFEKLSQDLRNTYRYRDLTFVGKSNRLSCPSIILTNADKKSLLKGKVIPQMGRVDYYFDRSEKAIFRNEANFGEAINDIAGKSRRLISHIHKLKFRYFVPDSSGHAFQWKEEIKGIIPLKVECTIAFEVQNHRNQMTKQINIPIGR